MLASILSILLFISPLLLGANTAYLQTPSPSLSVLPEVILQGNPFMVQIQGAKVTSIKNLTFNGKKLGVFVYQDKPSALYGVDLNKKPGTYDLQVEFVNGDILKKSVVIEKRDKTEAPLGIPEKLGGNTKASQDKLVSSLAEDNKSLVGLPTDTSALWSEKFTSPLKQMFVTAPYGNSRKTGVYSIPHKGTDYRAKIGTDVLAINRGIVRLTKEFRNHGKTIVIDHGQGLMSYYLHLSKINVKVGDVVEKGQVIAQSGDTGYTIGPHLHLGIRIHDIAIDPENFFKLFK